MRRRWVAVAGVGMLLLAGCSAATKDRSNGNPDATSDTAKVKVFLNADKVPNVALFCITPNDAIGPIAMLSTLSGTDSGESKASAIVRIPELDVPYCGGKPK